jgi:hypothetical protein
MNRKQMFLLFGRLLQPFREFPSDMFVSLFFYPVTIVIATLLWNRVTTDFFRAEILWDIIPGELNLVQSVTLGTLIWLFLSATIGVLYPKKNGIMNILKVWGTNFVIYIYSLILGAFTDVLLSVVLAILIALAWQLVVPNFFGPGVTLGFWLKSVSYLQAFELCFSLLLFPLWARFGKGLKKQMETVDFK